MENVARVGIDLGKQVFHLTAVDAGGEVVERRRLRRTGLRSYLSELPRARSAPAPLRGRFERLFNAGDRLASRHAPSAARDLRCVGGSIRRCPHGRRRHGGH